MAKHMLLVPLKKDPYTGAVTRGGFDPEAKRPGTNHAKGLKSVPYALGRALIRSGDYEMVGEFDDGKWSPDDSREWNEPQNRRKIKTVPSKVS